MSSARAGAERRGLRPQLRERAGDRRRQGHPRRHSAGSATLIDPRVQGTVTLASGRPVPKSDLLLRAGKRAAAVRRGAGARQRGYRLLPPTEAVGGGAASTARRARSAGFGITVVPLQLRLGADTLSSCSTLSPLKPGTRARRQRRATSLIVQGSGADRAQRGRHHAELRRRLDARTIGRHLSGAQQRARAADHQRTREDHGFAATAA